MNIDEIAPLPDWIIDHGRNYYSLDIEKAITAGETIPIDLGKIPQFKKFFTNPPTEAGEIRFVNNPVKKLEGPDPFGVLIDMYFDKTRNEYMLFDENFIDSDLGLKMAHAKSGLSKIDFWKCVHDMLYNIVIGWRIRFKLWIHKILKRKP